MATNLTADAVIAKIRAKVGATWMGGTSETIEYGDGSAPVTGIATVWTPSIEVLKRAAAAKHNFIVAVEPPFWVEAGTVKTEATMGPPKHEQLVSSPAYQEKKKLMDDSGLVVWRFNENYAALPRNPRLNALASALGYKAHENAAATQKLADVGAGVYTLPETTLRELAQKASDARQARALRMLGDSDEKVKSIVLKPGYLTNADIMAMVHDRNVDVVVCGEACEWEAFEYAEDWITAGWGKGMIMLGRAVSEDPGAKELASWVKSIVPEVPVTGFEVGEPFNYIPSHNKA